MKNSVALMLCVAFLVGCSGHGGVAAQPGVPAGSAPFAEASIAPDALDPFSELPSYRYKLPTQGAQAGYVAVGSDGAVWFTEFNEPKIGRVDPLGVLTEYTIPSGNYGVEIAAGQSGMLWFTEIIPTGGPNPAAIGSISTSGTITEYPVPNAASSQLQGIALGSDGNMWFVDSGNDVIGTITPAGVITIHGGIHLGAFPFDITPGPSADNDLWFTEKDLGRVGRITIGGTVTEFMLPSSSSFPRGIVLGSDGNLWIAESATFKIATMTTGGTVTEYDNQGSELPYEMGSGPDGNVWIASPSGVLQEFVIATKHFNKSICIPKGCPHGSAYPANVAAGSDGDLWFGSVYGSYIGVLEETMPTVNMRITGEQQFVSPTYGPVFGYFRNNSLVSQVVTLAAGESVRFKNVELPASGIMHTASFLGDATAHGAPWPPSFDGSQVKSPAGTVISTSSWSTGPLAPGKTSEIYETGAPGFYMIGCAFHYNDAMSMRTVLIVK
jgi:streptogramin lyase/plastocyanin